MLTIKIGIPKMSPSLRELIAGVPWDGKKAASSAFTSVIYNHLRQNTYPPPKYVTRMQAYGQTFQSDRQRRWFFANLNDGTLEIPYPRTGGLGEAWNWTSAARSDQITNNSPAAPWTIGDSQSAHEKMVGWRHWTYIVAERLTEALAAATSALNDWFAARPWVRRK